jgi:hypothetical protein
MSHRAIYHERYKEGYKASIFSVENYEPGVGKVVRKGR